VAIQESLGRSCCSESGRRIILLNTLFFYFLSAIAVGSAILMATRRNIAHAAIFLVTALLATAGIFLRLQSEFLFIVQVFLYAGGIMVLFVFAIMSLDPGSAARLGKFSRRQRIAATVALVLGAQILYAVFVGRNSLRFPALQANISPRNTEAIGDALFHQFIVPFEIVSVLLLVTMIGAAVMTRRRV
jgi:NADH-quinone oxidoreductase subunit J